ncbi:MAG: hypothetical protein IKI76_09390 [Selenomonadaceae bacterium]|nr:hypothetical protein [Selenomonadaceae bacterium]
MSNSKEKKREKICPHYDGCPRRLHPLSATDSPNMAAHLGFRFSYTVLAWFILGYKVNEGFFVSMFFFVLPVFMDCVKYTPLKKLRKYIKMVSVLATGLLLFVSILGVFGIYTLSKETGEWQIVSSNFVVDLPSEIGLNWLWGLLILIVLVTFVDWLCNYTKLDGG